MISPLYTQPFLHISISFLFRKRDDGSFIDILGKNSVSKCDSDHFHIFSSSSSSSCFSSAFSSFFTSSHYFISPSFSSSPFYIFSSFTFSPFWAADPKGTVSYRTEGGNFRPSERANERPSRPARLQAPPPDLRPPPGPSPPGP